MGGCATNTSSALAELGLTPHLMARTSLAGRRLLEILTKGVDLSHVKTDGEMALTVALELELEGRQVNLMIGDLGSVADFGPDSLTNRDRNLLKAADMVCVFSWNLNRRGTELARSVLKFVREKGRALTYLDSGDPSTKVGEMGDLIHGVLGANMVDALSVNENEALWFASEVDVSLRGLRNNTPDDSLSLRCSRVLRDELKVSVDLHTPRLSASFDGDGEHVVPAFPVSVRRITGAGDVWNAGNIYGYLSGMDPRERLTLANAVAAYYISDRNGRHPSRKDIIRFLRKSGIGYGGQGRHP